MTRARLLLAAALALLGACSLSVDPDDLAPQGPPGAPSGLSATPGNGSATLTWNAVTGDVARYEIHRGTAPGNLSRIGDVPASANTYVATGLTNGVPYYFAVAAVDSAGTASGLSDETVTVPVVPDSTPPTATVDPADNTVNVALDATLSIFFSEPMNVGSVTVAITPPPATPGVALSAPLWSPDNTTVSFTMTGLVAEKLYTVYVAGSDLAGNGMTLTTDFTTVGIPPTLVTFTPSNAATNVPIATKIELQFSEAMTPASVFSSLSILPAVTCAGGLSWNDPPTKATCTPSSSLSTLTNYTVTVLATAADANGNTMTSARAFTFQTADAVHTLAPSVSSSSPAHGASGVSRWPGISVTFNEAVDKLSAESAFGITSPSGYGGGTFSWSSDGKTMTYSPPSEFAYGTPVTWRLTTGVKCLGGVNMTLPVTRSFTVTRQGSVTLYSVAGLDGYLMYGASSVWNTTTVIYVGDSTSNVDFRGFVSFDLSSIPSSATMITSATLYVTGTAYESGDPFAGLGGSLLAQSVDYGTSLTSADFETAVLTWTGYRMSLDCTPLPCRPVLIHGTWPDEYTLAVAAGATVSTVDVTGKVERDRAVRATRGNRCQFRFRFPNVTDGDSAYDYWGINSGEVVGTARPYLKITYEYP